MNLVATRAAVGQEGGQEGGGGQEGAYVKDADERMV